MEESIQRKSETELKEMIVRTRNAIPFLSPKLPDNGERLKLKLRRCEEEIERRKILQPNSINLLLGPWGGEDGGYLHYAAKGTISCISITSDDNVIRSISFISTQLENGDSDRSIVFGTPTGPLEEITIDPRDEKLVLMEGIVGIYNSIEAVTQLSFTSSKNGVTTKHGPYGSKQKGTEFSCPLSYENPIAGFHGHSASWLNSIGVIVVAKRREIVPPWGGDGGAPWSYTTPGTISHISIGYGDVISSIRFTSVDSSGHLKHSGTFGDSDPKYKYREIKIDTKVERLNGITGTYGKYGELTLITSLAFTTNNLRRFGPFGTRRGTPFEYKVKDDELIAGFHGRAGSLIDAIGVYKQPSIITTNGVRVGPFGGHNGNKWEYQPKGLISCISITYGSVINSLCFGSTNEEGTVDHSQVYGKEIAANKYEINIDTKGEKLNCISGTIDTWGDTISVTSLYISTDMQNVYGPFGTPERGTHFSIPVKDGFLSGFYGNSGDYINSIGVYISTTIQRPS